jgi:hypothetical protein
VDQQRRTAAPLPIAAEIERDARNQPQDPSHVISKVGEQDRPIGDQLVGTERLPRGFVNDGGVALDVNQGA